MSKGERYEATAEGSEGGEGDRLGASCPLDGDE